MEYKKKKFAIFVVLAIAVLYHLEEWLNCHWKSVKVIAGARGYTLLYCTEQVGGHFLYLLMAEEQAGGRAVGREDRQRSGRGEYYPAEK